MSKNLRISDRFTFPDRIILKITQFLLPGPFSGHFVLERNLEDMPRWHVVSLARGWQEQPREFEFIKSAIFLRQCKSQFLLASGDRCSNFDSAVAR